MLLLRTTGLFVALSALAVLLVPSAPAQAVDETEFIVSVTEASDTPPMAYAGYDLKEVALGEPGDGTVVFRGTLAGAPSAPADGVVYFGFTTAAGGIVGGCTFAGAPDTRNIGEPVAPDSCLVSGAIFYAVYSYETAEVAIGDTITAIWGFTDTCNPGACFPADTAPGGIGPDGWPASTFGTDYPVTGCTRTGGCGGGGGSTGPIAPTGPSSVNLTGPSVSHSFTKASNESFIFNATSPGSDIDLTYEAAPGSGSVHLVILTPSGDEVVNKTIAANETQTQRVRDAEGTWIFKVDYSNFTGRLHIALDPHVEVIGGTTTSASARPTTTNDDSRTGGFPLREEEKTPGLGSAAIVLLLAAVAVAIRRRLR